jgi:hypothetical protein
MLMFFLVKQGYGSLNQMKELDTPELLDIIEYENILKDIELHQIESVK